jgi:glutamine amidotransferase
MQLLANSSEEGFGVGLGLIPGRVVKFEKSRLSLLRRVPHMGWNRVLGGLGSPLFDGIEDGSRFYFLHSYYYKPADLACGLARTDFGGLFTSAVRRDRVFGVQFHPEKSHRNGVRLLQNFAKI